MNIDEIHFVHCTKCGLVIKQENSYTTDENKTICADCNKKLLTNN